MWPSRFNTDSEAAIRPSTGTRSGSLLPPVKSNFTRPFQRTAGGGSPGAKSNEGAFIAAFLRYLSLRGAPRRSNPEALETGKTCRRVSRGRHVALAAPRDDRLSHHRPGLLDVRLLDPVRRPARE